MSQISHITNIDIEHRSHEEIRPKGLRIGTDCELAPIVVANLRKRFGEGLYCSAKHDLWLYDHGDTALDEHIVSLDVLSFDGVMAANGRVVEIDASRLQSVLELARVAARRIT